MRTSRLFNSIRWAWLWLLMFGSSKVCAQSVPTDTAQYHYELGIAAAESKQYQKALTEFQTSYAIRQNSRLLINIGRVNYWIGNFREAISAYENYLNIEPNSPPSINAKVNEYLAEAKSELQRETIPIKDEKSPRPLWRWLTGSAISAGGLSILSLGAYSLSQDGRCANMPIPPSLTCQNIYDTKSVGIPMVAVGGLTVAVGVAILAWPRKPARRPTEIK